MRNSNRDNRNKGKLEGPRTILNKNYVTELFLKEKDSYFPDFKKEKIIGIDIKGQSPDWMKNSCLAKYKISFSKGHKATIRATAHVDGSKKEVFRLMKIVYSKGFAAGKFQTPRPLSYCSKSKALFYEEAPGKPLALILEQNLPSPAIFRDIAVFLAYFHQIKEIRKPAVIFGKRDYQRAFSRIRKILPSLEKKIIPIKKIPFLSELENKDTFIHGDLYAGNIIAEKEKIYFIDLDKSGKGSIFLDLAPLYFSLEFPESIWKIKPKKKEIEKFQKIFLETYCEKRGFGAEKTRF